MTNPLDLSKSLDELEGTWPADSTRPTHLSSRCHALHKLPLSQFTLEDLRIMIGQEIGLQFLVPLALDRLESNPLAEGDFYPGDLLASVLQVEPSFWREWPRLRVEVTDILKQVSQVPKELTDAVSKFRQLAL